MEILDLLHLLDQALKPRLPLLDNSHTNAIRLFNGFYEGLPGLTVDLFASTLLISNLSDPVEAISPLIHPVKEYYLSALPFIDTVLLKTRHAADAAERNGTLIHGSRPSERINEDDTWYALDLQMNQDAGFYLDTRLLRAWLKTHSAGKSVLNCFAYTGSLGVAALSGGAASVLQTDLNRRFLDLAQRSAALNPNITGSQELQSGDFFRVVGGLRHQSRLFDIVILDAPFFSQTHAGRVDLVGQFTRLVNKVRPLVAHNGWLVVINNALFVSGEQTLVNLKALCTNGYMEIEELIPVPNEFLGYTHINLAHLPADPAPYNHPTKITVLRVRRKA